MFEGILINPLLAITFSAAIAALLGSFVLWKKLIYFGDSMSHSTLLVVALVPFFTTEVTFSVFFMLAFAVVFAILVEKLQKRKIAQSNVVVMSIAYFSVSLAIILKEALKQNVDFSSYVFGDIFLAGRQEVISLFLVLFGLILFFALFFKKFLLVVIDEDLAKISKVNVRAINLGFLCLLAVAISFMAKAVGILLMTALLILPAAISRIFAKSPLQMILLSIATALIVSLSAFCIANHFDFPVSPLMILILCLIFFASSLMKRANFND